MKEAGEFSEFEQIKEWIEATREGDLRAGCSGAQEPYQSTCFWINRMGAIAIAGHRDAERYLAELLDDPQDRIRCTAAAYLFTAADPLPETTEAVRNFRESTDPEVVATIERMIERSRSRC